MSESWDSIAVLCHSAVLLGVTELCTACYRLIKQGLFSERVALSPRCKLAMREGLQLHDCALMLGSFYQVLKICARQSKDCTRLLLLQCSSGYDNCHLQLRLEMAWGYFSAPGILLQLDFAFKASTSLFLIFMICKLLVTWPLPLEQGGGMYVLLGSPLGQGRIKALFKNKYITFRYVSGTVHFPLWQCVYRHGKAKINVWGREKVKISSVKSSPWNFIGGAFNQC